MTTLDDKIRKLGTILENYGSLLVAFSGGVDSSLLLKVAADTLGDRVAAFTEASPLHQSWELAEARELAASLGVRHIVLAGDELASAEFAANPPERCYLCKSVIFGEAAKAAAELGLNEIADGSNLDDLGDYRPGRRALAEMGIKSPLIEAGLTKAEIREASRILGLPTWNRQPLACLASRFPYGTEITRQRLRQVEECETFLRDAGFTTFRVRYHGDLARIEVAAADIERLTCPPLRQKVIDRCKAAGFTYVTVDLDGFRSGSMNEALDNPVQGSNPGR
jgi:pyridinium-3,5-biscarboxylic acid mononucleotide sulfurtransferase